MPNRFSGHSITCFRGERFVFEALDFSVESGEALVLTGPNGSGKSSLIRIMAGLLAAVDGRLEWNGESVSQTPEDHHARLHYVGYQDAIKPVMTVRENLAFWAGLRGAPNGVAGALRIVGLGGIAEMPAQFLSSGQRRRLSLARIVASTAEVWLLDEPTVGLDRNAIGILESLIAEHRAGGGMAVLATHQPIALGGDERRLDISRFAARRQIFDDVEVGQ
ncbi:MAG: heme ABC exporter ATP-binding protein CcmA [Alphaproteobacteria bacterium]|nr:heme ABC exporter ATP-binding protein CcmA [Alphaproteobacteria bacterium]